MLNRYAGLVVVFLLLMTTGCTLDSSGLGEPLVCPAESRLEGCFSRTPAEASFEDPEMFIQINREDACGLTGHGWGLAAPYSFTGDFYDASSAELNAITAGDEEHTEQYTISVELTGDEGGILLTVTHYRAGSSGEWESWPEPYDRPYHLARTECQ